MALGVPHIHSSGILPNSIEAFQRTKNRLPFQQGENPVDRSYSEEKFKERWISGKNLQPMILDEEFMLLLKKTIPSLTVEREPDLDLHLNLNQHERLNWPAFLEGHAKYFQRAHESVLYAVSADDNLSKHSMHGLKDYEEWSSIYSRMRRLMRAILGEDTRYCDAGEIVTLQALADLAANPSLDANYFFPNELSATMQTFFPGQRFAWACVAANRTKSIGYRVSEKGMSLAEAYKSFVSDLCSWLGWEPPWFQAQRWLDRYPMYLGHNMGGFFPLNHFLQGCRLRLDEPLFFGIPSHASKSRSYHWLSFLSERITAPAFASRRDLPLFYVSKHNMNIGMHDMPLLPQQVFALSYDVLDQLMICEGPLDWELVSSALGGNESSLEKTKQVIKRDLSQMGIDIERMVY